MTTKITVVTGANRGLGLATAHELAKQGHHTILTGRDAQKLEQALAPLRQEKLPVEGVVLDVADPASVQAFFVWLRDKHGRLDVLVNNAGTILESGDGSSFEKSSISNVSAETVLAAFENNALSMYRMIQHALPMMRAQGYGRIVNLSSGMGGLTDMGRGFAAYRISKTAINAITRLVSQEVQGNIKVNAVCPGWVRTDMGGPNATRDIPTGIAGIVWAATLDQDGPNGGFFRDGKSIPW